MKKPYTISTHNGSTMSTQHNLRNRRVTDKEPHIDPDGKHEVWVHTDIREAYRRLFGASVAAYNETQPRADRQIPNYLAQVTKSAKQHPAYELIVAVGSADHHPEEEECRRILREFCSGWKQANPNLAMIGAYYHADEQGTPHVHIDYVPVAHGYKRGPETQTGLVKALGEMGFHGRGQQTAQIAWEKRENSRLEGLCRARGINIYHPTEKAAEHVSTRSYKASKQADRMEQRLERVTREEEAARLRLTVNEERAAELGMANAKYERLQESYIALRDFISRYKDRSGRSVLEIFDEQQAAKRSAWQRNEVEYEFPEDEERSGHKKHRDKDLDPER